MSIRATIQTLPKAQRTRGLSSAWQSYLFRLYQKFLQKTWSKFIFSISTKRQLQNLNQTSTFQLNLNFKILTKPSFRISTNVKLYDLNQGSAAKYWPIFSFKTSPALQLQNLDQTLYFKSKQKFSFMTKPQLRNLQQIVANTIPISMSYNINKFWVGIFSEDSSHARVT